MFSSNTTPHRIERILVMSLAMLFSTATVYAQETAWESDGTEAEPEAAPAEPAPEPQPAPAAEPAPAPEPEPEAEPVAEPAAEPEAASEEAEAEEEASSAGINVDVGISTIYNFRGYNSFQENSQQDQNAAFFPSLTWSVFDTGLYMGYWGAYQLTGDNKSEMVAGALGHEQDLYIGYDLGMADDLLTLSFAFTYFFYPFADEDLNGTGNPSIIEPLVGLGISTVLDLGFTVSYFHGIQDDIDFLRHVYFNLSAGKGFEFNDTFGMNLGMSFGAKVWIEENDSNRFDLLFDWSVPISLTEQLYLEPGIHLGWTDLESITEVADDGTVSTRDAHGGDEFMVYGSVNIGADF